MRLEIIIADDQPEANILRSKSDPAGFVLDLVRRTGELPEVSAVPDYAAAIKQIRQSPNRFKTKEEIDAYIKELRSDW